MGGKGVTLGRGNFGANVSKVVVGGSVGISESAVSFVTPANDKEVIS